MGQNWFSTTMKSCSSCWNQERFIQKKTLRRLKVITLNLHSYPIHICIRFQCSKCNTNIRERKRERCSIKSKPYSGYNSIRGLVRPNTNFVLCSDGARVRLGCVCVYMCEVPSRIHRIRFAVSTLLLSYSELNDIHHNIVFSSTIPNANNKYA